MSSQTVTKKDLDELKAALIQAFDQMLVAKKTKRREWLKTYEVIEVLHISKSTLKQLRENGTLNYTRFGRCIYYRYSDIELLMNVNNKRE